MLSIFMNIDKVFKANTFYDGIGYCMFADGPYITIAHATPCTPHVLSLMETNGYTLVVQPIKMYVEKNSDMRDSYIATYRFVDAPRLTRETYLTRNEIKTEC